MGKRSPAEKAYDRARSRALEDMCEIYPEIFAFLREKLLEEYRKSDSPLWAKYKGNTNAIYDQARRDAQRQLRDLRPGAWFLLLGAWGDHYRAEYAAS